MNVVVAGCQQVCALLQCPLSCKEGEEGAGICSRGTGGLSEGVSEGATS